MRLVLGVDKDSKDIHNYFIPGSNPHRLAEDSTVSLFEDTCNIDNAKRRSLAVPGKGGSLVAATDIFIVLFSCFENLVSKLF